MIRQLETSDLVAVLKVEEMYPDLWPHWGFKNFFATSNCHGYVIGDVDGYILVREHPDHAFIEKVAVKVPGNGLGTRLLQFVLQKHPVVRLHVRPENPALRLYKRLGFVILETIPNYYTSDGGTAFLMERQ